MRRLSLLRRHRSDQGMTLVEVLVTVSLLGIVSAIFTGFLFSIQNTDVREQNRSQSNDEARAASEQIARQVRSGNFFYDPAQEATFAGLPSTSVGYAFRVYTQALSQAVTPNGARCVQWRVINQQLQTRSWTVTWQEDNQVTGWDTVAYHVVNSGASQQPFALDPSSTNFLKVLDINILINNSPGKQQNVQVTDGVTGRNTNQGYPSITCGDTADQVPPP